jgi:hypothetical protein
MARNLVGRLQRLEAQVRLAQHRRSKAPSSILIQFVDMNKQVTSTRLMELKSKRTRPATPTKGAQVITPPR